MESVLHVEHHAYQPAAGAAQQPGPAVGAVAQLLGGAPHPLPGSRCWPPAHRAITMETSATDTPARAATSASRGRRLAAEPSRGLMAVSLAKALRTFQLRAWATADRVTAMDRQDHGDLPESHVCR